VETLVGAPRRPELDAVVGQVGLSQVLTNLSTADQQGRVGPRRPRASPPRGLPLRRLVQGAQNLRAFI
jgi:hypothetical protein